MKILAGLGAALLCILAIRRHKPVRQWAGFRCQTCGKPGDSFDDFDYAGYVRPLRKSFRRGREGGVTQSSEWIS